MAQWGNAGKKGKWNLKLETEDGTPIDPMLSMVESDIMLKRFNFHILIAVVMVSLRDYCNENYSVS